MLGDLRSSKKFINDIPGSMLEKEIDKFIKLHPKCCILIVKNEHILDNTEQYAALITPEGIGRAAKVGLSTNFCKYGSIENNKNNSERYLVIRNKHSIQNNRRYGSFDDIGVDEIANDGYAIRNAFLLCHSYGWIDYYPRHKIEVEGIANQWIKKLEELELMITSFTITGLYSNPKREYQ